MANLGARIRELRERRRLGQAELARAIKRLPQDVYKWEHGRQVPSDELPAIAEALGVSISSLFGEEGQEGEQVVSYRAQLDAAVDAFRQVLERHPDRVEVRVYVRGEPAPAPSSESAEFVPTRADWDTRHLVERWDSLSEEDRRSWLEFAEAIRSETNR